MKREALCAALMLPLITVLEAPPPKPKTPVYDDDTEEESQDEKEKENVGGTHNPSKISDTGMRK